MLIEFSVSNFRSFREQQTISMVAAPRLKKKGNTLRPVVDGEKLPDLLKIAAIYGPNASGKSNLIRAIETVKSIASLKPSAAQTVLPIMPFRFDPMLAAEPSRFELHFVHRACRYEFVLSATEQRIHSERLISYPKGKETLLFDRRHTASGDIYEFGSGLEGGSELHETWRKLTGPQVLFIAQAVANSNEDLQQLKAPFEWLTDGMMFVGQHLRMWASSTQGLAKDFPAFADRLSTFLRTIDVPVSDIRFDQINESPQLGLIDFESMNESKTPSATNKRTKTKTTFIHKTALGEAEFSFDEESDGTQNLIGFCLPWSILERPIEGRSKTVIVDELDSSLHPLIVASLIERHLNNNAPTQLIFTTHDTHLMDAKLLRRDQFWLTERDGNGATKLRSVHDFEGREGEDIEKRYYDGRYRSLPFVRKG